MDDACAQRPYVPPMITQRTLHVTAVIAAAGGAAWLAKMAVITASDGATGGTSEAAAAVLYLLGVLLLAAGASAVTLRLARGRGRAATAVAVLASPVVFWASFMLLEAVAKAVVGDTGPSWLKDEAGILLTGAVWLSVGAAAVRAGGRPG